MAKKRKPKPTKKELFEQAVDTYLSSENTSQDMLDLMVQFHMATRPDSGLSYQTILDVLKEKMDV